MEIILSNEQINAMHTIHKEIVELHSSWEYDGSHNQQNAFYNSRINACFLADYYGNITAAKGIEKAEIPENAKEHARLEGMIRRIVDGENIEGVLNELSNNSIDRK